MKTILPAIHGTIDRRMLINYRIHPDVLRPLLPSFFRLKLVQGWAMAGICLIRLKAMRPHGFPACCGLNSENAAHRIAVEWDEPPAEECSRLEPKYLIESPSIANQRVPSPLRGEKVRVRGDRSTNLDPTALSEHCEKAGPVREGVYVARRDTSSFWQSLAGGRLFPGLSPRAEFVVNETENELALQMQSRDGAVKIELQACRAKSFAPGSIFKSLSEASEFFARGSIGYSPAANPHCCDGMELCARNWHVKPLDIQHVRSSFFDDRTRFPDGAVHLDCALLMENIDHDWRVLPRLEGPR
jgi:hypothetical protein